MPVSDRELGAALGSRSRASGCPDAEQLAASAAGRLDADRQAAVASHLASCADCAAEWRVARGLHSALAGEARRLEPGSALAGVRRGVRPLWLAAAAGLAGLLLLPILLRAPDTTVLRGPGPASLVVDENLPADACVLRWTPGPPGARYDIEVRTAEGRRLVGASGLRATEFRVPAEAMDELAPGSAISWTLSTTLAGGARLPPSTFTNRIASPAGGARP